MDLVGYNLRFSRAVVGTINNVVVVNVVNAVAISVFVVVATGVIFDIFVVFHGVVIDIVVKFDVIRVVNCTNVPCILMVATAARRHSGGAATPARQR